jgi:hypothetical protein
MGEDRRGEKSVYQHVELSRQSGIGVEVLLDEMRF